MEEEDLILALPDELVVYVFGFFTLKELCHASLVCKKWEELSSDHGLWKSVYCKTFAIDPKRKGRVLMATKEDIVGQLVLDKEWKRGNHVNKKNISSETAERYSPGRIWAVHFDQEKIVVGDTAHNIHIWDWESNLLQSLRCASREIRYLRFKDNYLATATYGSRIYVWNMEEEKVVQELVHRNDVYCLQFDETKVVSCSRDQSVYHWDKETGATVHEYKGHTSCVRACAFKEHNIVSGGEDNTGRLWDVRTGDCTSTLEGHSAKITTVKFDEKRILTGGFDRYVREWDPRNMCKPCRTFERPLEDHQGDTTGSTVRRYRRHPGVWQLEFDDHKLVTSHQDATVSIWDVNTGERCHTFREHTGAVISLFCDRTRLVTGAEDGHFIVYQFA